MRNRKVVIGWENTGSHTNGMLFNIPASGKKVTVNGITILTIQNCLVISENGIVDNLALFKQLGGLE